jgi:hypothetical protein
MAPSPSAAAVLRLITKSNFSGCCIGKSLGLDVPTQLQQLADEVIE